MRKEKEKEKEDDFEGGICYMRFTREPVSPSAECGDFELLPVRLPVRRPVR
jgi:hypothetical protein